jgi:hypothetical protein
VAAARVAVAAHAVSPQSRGRAECRSRSRSSSSSSSSEDSEEREERERRREAREEKAAEEKVARKAAREKAAAKAQAEREQAEAVHRLGRTTWRFVAAGDEDEDCFSLHICGQKPESLGFLAATIDCTSWDLLNDFLRLEPRPDVIQTSARRWPDIDQTCQTSRRPDVQTSRRCQTPKVPIPRAYDVQARPGVQPDAQTRQTRQTRQTCQALKDRTHAVGDLKRPSTLTTMLKRHVLLRLVWVTLLCEVVMVTHNDAKCISYAFSVSSSAPLGLEGPHNCCG